MAGDGGGRLGMVVGFGGGRLGWWWVDGGARLRTVVGLGGAVGMFWEGERLDVVFKVIDKYVVCID